MIVERAGDQGTESGQFKLNFKKFHLLKERYPKQAEQLMREQKALLPELEQDTSQKEIVAGPTGSDVDESLLQAVVLRFQWHKYFTTDENFLDVDEIDESSATTKIVTIE